VAEARRFVESLVNEAWPVDPPYQSLANQLHSKDKTIF
jgi:hypothetical protein